MTLDWYKTWKTKHNVTTKNNIKLLTYAETKANETTAWFMQSSQETYLIVSTAS